MPTLAQAIDEGARRLQNAEVDEGRRSAGVLLCHVLAIERTHLLTRSQEQIEEQQYRAYAELIERRAAGEPLQYITGHQEFYGLDFIVTPEVLIPRPETEFLVERAVEVARELNEESPLIADIGTGSGCVAVAVAVQLRSARVIATDISQAAIEVARQNAERHRVIDRVEFLVGDLLTPLAGLKGALTILLSNPPYVDRRELNLIQHEVRDWEPHRALFGGSGGLEFHRRLLAEGFDRTKAGGYLVFEIGYGQLEAISEIIAGSRWELIDVTRDLQGLPRTLTVRKPGGHA